MAETKCFCPIASNPSILQRAIDKFDTTNYVTGLPMYEYGWGKKGEDSDNNGMWEVDCSFMVNWAINTAFTEGGACGHFPYLPTNYFNAPSGLPTYLPGWREHQLNKWKYRDMVRKEYFCKIDNMNEVGPGDIIVFQSASGVGHMGIVETIQFKDGRWQGKIFHSTTAKYYIVPFANPFNGPQHGDWYLNSDPQATDLGGTSSAVKITGFYRPKVCLCDPELPPWQAQAAAHQPYDPLVLNLNGKGITTVGLAAGIHFDHDGNGMQESTGWVTPGNGVLMLDRNGDDVFDGGNELFGDFTILPNGTFAANGFQALEQYDSNRDGKIDAGDPIWTQLKIWQYSESDLEAYDPDVSGQIVTLDELGITAIHLDSTITNRVDSEGNTEIRSGYFEWADGRVGTISEYRFERDTSATIPVEYAEVPLDIDELPELSGHGNVYSLHQAMVRDTSGQLKALVEDFASASSPPARSAILEQIILKWTGVESVASNSRGPFMDGRKIAALEQLYGESRHNPNEALAIDWRETYRDVFEMFYGSLMAQTHLKDLYDKIIYTWDGAKQEYKMDGSAVVTAIQDSIATNPSEGLQLLSEFARSRRGLGYYGKPCYLSFRETFVSMGLGWAFDTGVLPVIDGPHQGTRTGSHMVEGTFDAEAVKGVTDPLAEGAGYINGITGDDVLYGTDLDEIIMHNNGNAVLVGGGGKDRLWAGDGNNILDGGTGDDLLLGGHGDDIYIFRVGSGHDAIQDVDGTPGNTDTIFLGGNLTPGDVALRRVGENLVLGIRSTDDTLTVKGFFSPGGTLNRVEQFQFMDGTVWTDSDIIRNIYAPTEYDDVVYGGIGDDTLNGLGGNDWLYALAGDDIVNGRSGDDTILGSDGNDTLIGETGRDTLYGDKGDDTLIGGAGDDTVVGGDGNDTLNGGSGNDVLYGTDRHPWFGSYVHGVAAATGTDTYIFGRGYGQDTIFGQNTNPENMDAIALDEGVLPSDIKLERLNNDL